MRSNFRFSTYFSRDNCWNFSSGVVTFMLGLFGAPPPPAPGRGLDILGDVVGGILESLDALDVLVALLEALSCLF